MNDEVATGPASIRLVLSDLDGTLPGAGMSNLTGYPEPDDLVHGTAELETEEPIAPSASAGDRKDPVVVRYVLDAGEDAVGAPGQIAVAEVAGLHGSRLVPT